jgi:hypothetical protein
VVEEKISLSERFGLWVSFYPFSQDEYLTIVAQWLQSFGVPAAARRPPEALVWALERGSRSTAWPTSSRAICRPRPWLSARTPVAVGILIRADGALLLSSRPEASPMQATGSFRAASWRPVKAWNRRCAASSKRNWAW